MRDGRRDVMFLRVDSTVFAAEEDYERMAGRVTAEYLEMPGLRLTLAQAQCLFGLDRQTCEAVLDALVSRRFLDRTPNGLYARHATP